MIKLDIEGDHFVISGSPLDRDRIVGDKKGLYPGINGLVSKGEGTWHAPLKWPIYVDASSTILKYGGEVSWDARQWGKEVGNAVKRLIEQKHSDTDETHQLGSIDLFPKQHADAKWLIEAGATGFVFSDMRTGKSHTINDVLNHLGDEAFPVLFALPPGVTWDAERNFEDAFPDRTVGVLSSGMTPAARKKIIDSHPDVLVLGYNLLVKHSKLSYFGGLDKKKRAKEVEKGCYEEKELNTYGFRTVIADEAQNIKDPKSQQTRAIWQLGDKAIYRFAMTGTPTSKEAVDNGEELRVNIEDMWALLRFAYPDCFPAKSKWQNKYLVMANNFYGIRECRGINPEMEKFWNMIFEPMFIRRLRDNDVEQKPRILWVRLEGKQEKAYKQLAKFEMAQIGDDLLVANDSLTLRRRMLQAAAATIKLDDGEIVGYELPSSKIDALLAWLDESDDKAIVYTADRNLFNLASQVMTDKGITHADFPGGLNNKQRAAAVDAFNNDPDVLVFFGMIQAANAGFDLPAGKRQFYLTMSEDPTEQEQSEKRAFGPKQTAKFIEMTYCVARDTMDEAVFMANSRKDANTHMLFRDPNWVKKNLHA